MTSTLYYIIAFFGIRVFISCLQLNAPSIHYLPQPHNLLLRLPSYHDKLASS
jgi:hypothetical protein